MRDLEENERRSVNNAARMIRAKGFKDEARRLDNMRQMKRIKYNDLPSTVNGKVEVDGDGNAIIRLNPALFPRGQILTDCDPRLVELATTLLHEMRHVLNNDESDAFNAEEDFLVDINREIDEANDGKTTFFSRCPKDKRTAIHEAKEAQLVIVRFYSDLIARRGGSGYGDGRPAGRPGRPAGVPQKGIKMVESGNTFRAPITEEIVTEVLEAPPEPNSEVEADLLYPLAQAIIDFQRHKGEYPPAPNSALVKSLQASGSFKFRRDQLNKKGEVVDPWGSPLVYIVPGNIHQSAFDLYSLGPCKSDEKGQHPNIMALLYRR